MRHILRGYTMYASGFDYGYETEEVMCPMPDQVYTERNYGGAVMTAQVPMQKVGLMEPTVKLDTYNPDMIRLLLRPPGVRDIFTFRASLISELDGAIASELVIYEGQLAGPSPDQWSREDKAGIEFTIKNVVYYRHEIGGSLMHEVGLNPAKMVAGGRDLLRVTGYNAALGRT